MNKRPVLLIHSFISKHVLICLSYVCLGMYGCVDVFVFVCARLYMLGSVIWANLRKVIIFFLKRERKIRGAEKESHSHMHTYLRIYIHTETSMHIHVYKKTCTYLSPPRKSGCDKRSFLTRIKPRVFFLLYWLPHECLRTKSVLLLHHSQRKNSWIHAFLKGMNVMWNANSLV